MIRVDLIFVALSLLLASDLCEAVQEKELDIRREVRELRKDFRVRVHYRYDEDFFFPAGSVLAKFDSSATELTEQEVRRALPVVRVFLSNYPERILRKHLNDVYLLKDLKMGGGGWGGTYFEGGIYINCRTNERYMLSTMFHEISSMLMKYYRFPTRTWQKVNGTDARYIGAQHFADGRNYGSATTRQGLELGFITNYASSSMENDFNEMSEWLFTRYYQLRRLGKEYPRIGTKMDLAIEFYKRIDEEFEFTDKAKL